MIDRTQLLRDIAQSLDIDPDEVIKSEERLQAEQALQAQALAGASQGGVMAQEPGPMEIGLGPVA